MLLLPYRATVFLEAEDGEGRRLEMIERHFKKEADAVSWCKTMTIAQIRSNGAWMVASSNGGRSLTITRAAGFPIVAEPLAYEGLVAAEMPLLARQEGMALTSRN